MYWSASLGWGMAWVGGGFMSHKTMVQNATFISSSCDEVTTINNQSSCLCDEKFLACAYYTEPVESDRRF